LAAEREKKEGTKEGGGVTSTAAGKELRENNSIRGMQIDFKRDQEGNPRA